MKVPNSELIYFNHVTSISWVRDQLQLALSIKIRDRGKGESVWGEGGERKEGYVGRGKGN
jgi:hypothetical protein